MKKPSLLQLLIMHLATIFFVSGLATVNVSIYYLFDTYIGILATGITLVVVALILNHEQSNIPPQGR